LLIEQFERVLRKKMNNEQPTLRNWFRRLRGGEPHFVIGHGDDPYMLRWYIIPRNRWLNIYLHKFLRDDDDRALHDHPWWFVSLMLEGCYVEKTDEGYEHRTAGSIAYRPAVHRHRVILERRENGEIKPCWTLIVTGRKSRTWGFWCPKGFVPWHIFVDSDDHGNVGRGCGEMS
jgi:hypothetical protein